MARVHQPTTDDPSEPDPESRPPWRALALLLVGTGALFGLGLGTLDLWAPDEPRYAAIAEELRSFRHGWRGVFLLHLNDAPYSQKPPLYFWLAAGLGSATGRVTEFVARTPSAIAGWLSVALVLPIGRRLLGRTWPAILAAGLLATSFRFVFTARRAQLDVLLTAFELVAVALFLALERRPGGLESARSRPGPLALLHAALGAAAIVKGPVGWLPLACFAAYLLWEGRIVALRAIMPAWSWGLSIGPLAAWGGLTLLLAPPGFAELAVGDNLWGRIIEGTSHARPFYYYLYQLPLDFLPWTVLLPLGLGVLWRAARAPSGGGPASPASTHDVTRTDGALARPGARFLIVWVALPTLLFTLSAGKRGVYLLPIFPALALVAALGFERVMSDRSPARRARVLGGWIAGVAAVELFAALALLPWLDAEKSPRPIAVAIARRLSPEESVGVYGLTPIEGAIGYYGRASEPGSEPLRVASLATEADLRAFNLGGGELVLLRERHWQTLGPRLGLTAVDHFRSGRRRLTLATFDPQIPEGSSSSLPEMLQ